MIGVNVNQTIRRAFALGGAFAGAAGFIFALYYGRPFGSHGAQSGLFAFMAALLGGIGNPIGDAAGQLAGRLRQPLRLWVLWPRHAPIPNP